MSAGYEVCLLTSNVQRAIPELRQKLSSLDGLHHKTFNCVELHYSVERDALLLRLSFSEIFSTRSKQRTLVQVLADRGFDVLESSELSATEKPRFEELLREQYQVRLQQYPSVHFPAVVSRIIDSLEAHLEPIDSDLLEARPAHEPHIRAAERLSTIDAFEHIISELPMLEHDGDGDFDDLYGVKATHDDERAATVPVLIGRNDDLPLRMETFGPLDDMIASLSRAETHEPLDAVLDSLWP